MYHTAVGKLKGWLFRGTGVSQEAGCYHSAASRMPLGYHRGLSLVLKSTQDPHLLVTKSQANLLGSQPPPPNPYSLGLWLSQAWAREGRPLLKNLAGKEPAVGMKYLPSCHGRKGRLKAEEAEPIVPSTVHGVFLQHWKFTDLNVIGRNSLEWCKHQKQGDLPRSPRG